MSPAAVGFAATPQGARVPLTVVLVFAVPILRLEWEGAVGVLEVAQLGDGFVGRRFGGRDRTVGLALRGGPKGNREEEPLHFVVEVFVIGDPVPAVFEDDVESLGRSGRCAAVVLVSLCILRIRDAVFCLEELLGCVPRIVVGWFAR